MKTVVNVCDVFAARDSAPRPSVASTYGESVASGGSAAYGGSVASDGENTLAL